MIKLLSFIFHFRNETRIFNPNRGSDLFIRFLITYILLIHVTGCGGTTSSASSEDTPSSVQWTRQLGVSGKETISEGVVTDSNGNIYVTGYTRGNLDGNTLTRTQDFFLTKYTTDGVKQWTKQMGAAAAETDANGIATDPTGNIYVTGYTRGSLDGKFLTGSQDLFLTKYTTDGVKQWTKLLGVTSAETTAKGIAITSSGNIYVTGTTNGSLANNALTGVKDLFLTKYISDGEKTWTKQLGESAKRTTSTGVSVDSAENSYITGYIEANLNGNNLAGSADCFLSKFASSGAKQWTEYIGTSENFTTCTGVTTEYSGNVFLTEATFRYFDVLI